MYNYYSKNRKGSLVSTFPFHRVFYREAFHMKKLANILLGIWLILSSLIVLTAFSFSGSSVILAIVAVIAGALLIAADRGEKFSARAANVVLGIWLILASLVPLIGIHFRGSHAVLAALALVAGVLVLIRR
jgi:hypothetical protein